MALVVRVVPLAAAEAKLDAAVLAGDWEKVAAILTKDDAKAADLVARLLMGHASLARNRNNDATLLFRSVTEAKELAAWEAWTTGLAKAKPGNAAALYLAADAAARSGDLEGAIEGFGKALQAEPGFALALNARGVALAVNGDLDGALIALSDAKTRANELADAHASFGTLSVLQGWSPSVGDGGLRAYNRALQLDPSFALAQNGRGCLWFGDGMFEEAAADFRRAAELLPSLGSAQINEGLAFAYASQVATLVSLDAKPGMSLEARFGQADKLVESKARELRATKDEVFWGIVRDFTSLPREQQRAFIQKHGSETVTQALQVRVYELSADTRRANTEVQAIQANMEGRAALNDRLKEADKWFQGIPTPAGITDVINLWRMNRNFDKTEAPSLRAAANAAEVRRIHGLPPVAELAKPTPPPQITRPPDAAVQTYAIPLSSAPKPGGVSTKEIERAFVNKELSKGNWPVLTTFTLGYRPAGEPAAGVAGAGKG